MIIHLGAGSTPTLQDVDNFGAFKVVCLDSSDLSSALSAVGRLDGDHVWIARQWVELNGRPEDPDWLNGLEKMLGYAASAGWIDGDGAIRAHIDDGSRLTGNPSSRQQVGVSSC